MSSRKKQKTEFPKSVLNNRREQFQHVADASDCKVSDLSVHRGGGGKRKISGWDDDEDMLIKSLVATKGLKSVYVGVNTLPVDEEGIRWVKVIFEDESSEPKSNVFYKIAPTIRSQHYKGNVTYLWAVKVLNEVDAINLQQSIAEKLDGKCSAKLTSYIRLADDIYFKDKEVLREGVSLYSDGRKYTSSWSTMGDTEYFANLVADLQLDLLPMPQNITLGGKQPIPPERKSRPLLVNHLIIDASHSELCNPEAIYISVLAATSSMLGEKVSVSFPDELSVDVEHNTSAVFSTCFLGREFDGSTEAIKAVGQCMSIFQKNAESHVKSAKVSKRVDTKFNARMEDANVALAVKAANQFDAVKNQEGYDLPTHYKSIAKQYGESEISCNFESPFFHTNNVQNVIDDSQHIHSALFIPLNLKRVFDDAKTDSNLEKNLAGILSQQQVGNVAILAGCTVTDWDNSVMSYEHEVSSYDNAASCFDIYLGSPVKQSNVAKKYQVTDRVSEELFSYLNTLQSHMSNLENVTASIQLSNQALSLLDEFYFDIDSLLSKAPSNTWVIDRLLNLKQLVFKLALSIAYVDSYDCDDKVIEPVEEISKCVFIKAAKLTLFIGEQILMLGYNEHIDYVNALSIVPKLRLLSGKFTARTLYKDKGWAGVKNNPLRTKGALEVLELHGWVHVVNEKDNGEEVIKTYIVHPSLRNSCDRQAPTAPSSESMKLSLN
ncbi:hypothetical protein L2735_11650 [Shewanella olleyana]|uniref:hypothetical protein n=1 Tax=Shewanella olleyana TaxID=135626 RepID=UPI0020105ED5|nr:hypothetical protein [Shewanella olleyana]MCL1067456.1 hypothetical protein [Shewanella olleyana]